mgnify:CR=1 FL=1
MSSSAIATLWRIVLAVVNYRSHYRHRHDRDADLRPPRRRWRDWRPLACDIQTVRRNAGSDAAVMSLRLRIAIAVIALGLSAFALFGDPVFMSLGLPSGSGRIVVAGVLLVVGVIWFLASSKSMRSASDAVRRRRK